jgi:hypothetical protein
MTSDVGRQTVQYLVRCALAANDSLVKQDQYGNNFTFAGGLGLSPGYKTGSCNQDCTEMLSACMMAHINTSGTHIPLYMDGPDSLGWGQSAAFPTREGTFFGQIMVTNTSNALDAYYCNGPGTDKNIVPGRLGATQGAVPYANAFPTSAGFDGMCDTSHKTGTCATYTTSGFSAADGDSSCTVNGTTWKHPITVWRSATYQAENAVGGAFVANNGNSPNSCTPGTSGCTWVPGAFGFNTSGCVPSSNGCAVIADSNNGMGQRVGYIGPSKGVLFSKVTAPATGSANVIVYYTDGDAYTGTRYLSFSVNGGAAQVKPFGGLEDWSHPRGAAITLSGFVAGATNTIAVTGSTTSAAPDLDWIEVVDTNSSVPNTGLCQPSLWTVTSSVSGSTPANLVDGNLTDRWTTNSGSYAGQYVQIDFTGSVNLSRLTLDNSQTSGGDYPGAYAVFSSSDGVNFSSTPFVTGSGTSGQTVISFQQENVRAIRIQATSTTNGGWWSIGEIETNCSL